MAKLEAEKSKALAIKLQNALKLKATGKQCYATSDALLKEVAAEIGAGVVVEVGSRKYTLIDKFKQEPVVYRAARFSRYEIHELE